MKLKDTIEMMQSEDYKERFKAEYYQTQIRCKKLCQILEDNKQGKLDFKINCPIPILERQFQDMVDYLQDLECRARIENIDI